MTALVSAGEGGMSMDQGTMDQVSGWLHQGWEQWPGGVDPERRRHKSAKLETLLGRGWFTPNG